MGDWIAGLNGLDIFFLICALVGGIPILIRFLMLFMGVDFAGDDMLDADFESGDGGDGFDPDASLRFISLHGLTSFLMMFGLVGYALYRQSQVGAAYSLIGGTVAGFVSFWVIAKIFKLIAGLQSSGTLEISTTLGCEGQVYLTIPPNDTGQVTVQVDNRLREFSAASETNEEIKTGTRIQVVRISGNILIVKPIQ
ncbi:NfeD family protein [Salidesulfovibrio onnuriiensis]|uniref:NfeD family protein n=1 Tax=Salidesulfovibrio onnuriiensis TaxID=2583823 RepID=UPI0011C9E72E|nr:NfeD family protein [Salidesulfovibrio onnuriiensis]